MTTRLSGVRAGFIALSALAAAGLAAPASAYITGEGTYTENFDNFYRDSYYIEDALPGAYVVDGYAERAWGSLPGSNGILTSYNHFDAVQIDFYQPQDYVSFTNAALGLHAWAYTNLYDGTEPVMLDEVIDLRTPQTSNGVLTLRSPATEDPDLYHPRISTVVFWVLPGQGAWAIDNLEWSTTAPEPATWGMMLGGFGLIGSAMRRRRTVRSPARA